MCVCFSKKKNNNNNRILCYYPNKEYKVRGANLQKEKVSHMPCTWDICLIDKGCMCLAHTKVLPTKDTR